jgi:enamine deaminase RidA (YjgF/YER057c/UK114 family)
MLAEPHLNLSNLTMHTISIPEAPLPAGHYSQGVVHNGIVYVAGQLAIDPAAPDDPRGDAAAQTVQALMNVRAHRPARAIVPVKPLKDDFVIEVQVIAAVPEGQNT